MTPNLDQLKVHLHDFAYESNLTLQEIGDMADKSSSVVDFENKLDELCQRYVHKNSSELLGDFTTRFAGSKVPEKPAPSENSPLQNEINQVRKKIDKLKKRVSK